MQFISQNNLDKLLARVAETKPVYLPYINNTINYRRFNGSVDHDAFQRIRPSESLKTFLFPPSEFVASFPKKVRKSIPEQIVIGAKRCDILGSEVYDHVFTEGEFKDPFYIERKQQFLIISVDCPKPEDSCFCNLVGLKPWVEGGSDCNLSPISDGYIIEAFTKKGKDFIKKNGDLLTDGSESQIKERNISRNKVLKILEDTNKGKNLITNISQDKKFWQDKVNGCVECFGCLHACPTCYCFLLYDVKEKKGFNRIRVWDGCYYAAYARVGGNINPRADFLARFKNRFLCKFDYFKQYYDMVACSGCGRCLKGCSANIDIREVVWQ